MSLTGRLTAFFLVGLAAVLLGFSGTLYGLAHSHLHRQLDARLDAVLDMLVAAAEFKAGGVEWEPGERRLALGRSPSAIAIPTTATAAAGTGPSTIAAAMWAGAEKESAGLPERCRWWTIHGRGMRSRLFVSSRLEVPGRRRSVRPRSPLSHRLVQPVAGVSLAEPPGGRAFRTAHYVQF